MDKRFIFPVVLVALLCAGPSLIAQPRDSARTQMPPIPAASDDADPTWDAAELRRRLVYPEDARRDSVEGKTIVRALVDRKGHALKCVVVESSGSTSLDKAVIAAVSGLKFTPAIQNGMPVAIWIELPVMFMLH